MGSFSEAKNQNLVAGQSGPADRNSAWSGARTPAPADLRPPRALMIRMTLSGWRAARERMASEWAG